MISAVPLSTYRLQLSSDFGFDDAARLVPYIKKLGITHVYSSPFLKARKGSKHGYDIVDHTAFNPEFGGKPGFIRLSDALRNAGIGLILDFVPNHMGIGYADNGWWLDVLEWGKQSPHAQAFDISWDLLPYRRSGGVMLPVLGQPYGEVLHSGQIELKYNAQHGTFSAWYFEHRFPISPSRYPEIIRTAVSHANLEDTSVGRALLDLAAQHSDPKSPSYREADAFKQQLAAIAAGGVIEKGLAAYSGRTDHGRQLLHRLLERQHYRLAYWRVAVSSINYRRFFDINDLAGIQVENGVVFHAIHKLVAQLVAEDRLQGLRLDHIDGLRDPFLYTRRLGQLVRSTRTEHSQDFHITVEKILGPDEAVPKFPNIAGTTGYEWLNVISRVLLENEGLIKLGQTWQKFSGETRSFNEIVREAKARVIETILASEFNVLTKLLARIAAGHYSTRDYTLDRLRAALESYVIELPIYRTYVTGAPASDRDRAVVEHAAAAARRCWPGSDPEIFDFLRSAITLDLLRDEGSYSGPRIRDFAHRLQQFTGPLMAKSLEDTAFYRHHRLVALNEVGNDPSEGGLAAEDFHRKMQGRLAATPLGLTATSTHDTKRGEDARMRILALADLAEDWAGAVNRWREMNDPLRADDQAPTRAHEYLLYQTLVGAWCFKPPDRPFVERIQAYMIKAAREGKEQTSWVNPNDVYENNLTAFVDNILDATLSEPFLKSFTNFASRIARLGALNSLSQVVLKATMPGISDFYQGTELWDLSLVDPDNRRPVDFSARITVLEAAGFDWSGISCNWPDGHAKVHLIHRLLKLRNKHPLVFLKGSYEPVKVLGPHRDHVLAFCRSYHSERVLVAVGRHFAGLTAGGCDWPSGWRGTIDLNAADWRDEIGTIEGQPLLTLDRLFTSIPVTVLSSGEPTVC